MDEANALRGEVDVVLDGQAFVLRPSYAATVAIEEQTGQPLIQLAMAADMSALSQNLLAIVITECIKAWGRAAGPDGPISQRVAAAVKKERIGELIYDTGIMSVMPRAAMVLSMAVSGGCLPSGEPKPTTGTTTEIPGAGSAE